MSRYDDYDGAGDEIGNRHFGMFFVEECVDNES